MNEDPQGMEAFAKRVSSWFDDAETLDASREGTAEDVNRDKRALEKLALINEIIEKRVAERTGLLRVLHDVTTIANEASTIDEAFRRVLKRVAEHNGWCFGHVYFVSRSDPDLLVRSRAYFEESPARFAEFIKLARSAKLRCGEGLPGEVLKTGEAGWVTDACDELTRRGYRRSADLGVKTAVAFPVKVDEQILAVFEFLSDKKVTPDQRVLDSMANIGTHLGLFVVRKRMMRTIAELSTREQQRIGRDLHDDLGQQLTGIALMAKSLERDLKAESSAQTARVAEIAQGLKETQTHVKLLARGLTPVEIDGDGLSKALADLAAHSQKRFEKDVRYIANVEVQVRDSEVATALYRIAQEAVTNAAKHGKATQIVISLSSTDDEIILDVRDNGIGVSEAAIRQMGFGMSTMDYRAKVIGGGLSIERGARGGTVVRCRVQNDDEVSDGEHGDWRMPS